MAYYLVQGAYSGEACAALLKEPEDRQEVVRAVVERMGGRIEGFWFSFGEYDFVLTCEMPNNATAPAFSMAISAGAGYRPPVVRYQHHRCMGEELDSPQ